MTTIQRREHFVQWASNLSDEQLQTMLERTGSLPEMARDAAIVEDVRRQQAKLRSMRGDDRYPATRGEA